MSTKERKAETSKGQAVPPTRLKAGDVATWLLKEGYALTALELYQELSEDGLEVEVLSRKFDQEPEPGTSEPRSKRRPAGECHA